MVSIQDSKGSPIHSVEDWFCLTPPKMGGKQWKDGRSAKELARAWFGTGSLRVPDELEALFGSHPFTKGLVIESGIPELVISLDNFRGETRNCDLILLGHVGDTPTLVGIEAKADEEFGPIISKYLRKKVGTRSRAPDRIDLLSRSIFGRPIDAELGALRYQLLHGLAGTLIEAKNRGAAQALFVVHEFISNEARRENVARNRADFEAFVSAVSGKKKANMLTGMLVGPIQVPGGLFVPGDVPVLIGKVATNLVYRETIIQGV